jgi:glycosyltransferase involved in cell wall biosynthesis
MKKISCIIPAYNEEKHIEHTLSVVYPLIGKNIYEVIVIDDSSQDNTKKIVTKFPLIHLIEHTDNKGKSKSVADGISASQGDYVFLLDADLSFLNEKNIIDLIDPVEKSTSDITISYIKNAWPLFPFKKIDYLSGERVLPKSFLTASLSDMASLPSYGLEVFLNRIIIRNHMSISVVQWPNVENNFNQYKHGWIKGTIIAAKIWLNVLSVVSFFEMYSQNIKLIKLIVPEKK